MKDSFARHIRRLRELRGLSQVKLAERAGIAVRTLRYWEAAEKLPRSAELESVLEVLGATADERMRLYSVVPLPRIVKQSKSISRMPSADDLTQPLDLGDIIRALRQRNGFTQSQFAAAMDVTPTTVMRWETLRSLPDQSNIDRICTLLNATPQEAAVLRSRELLQNDIPDRLDISSLRQQVDRLGSLASQHSPLTDLFALTLQHYLHFASIREPEAMYLLGRTLLIYGNAQFQKEYLAVAKTLANRSVRLFQQVGRYDVLSAQAVNLASVFIGGKGDDQFDRKVAYLGDALAHAYSDEMKLRLLCDMALYSSRAGRFTEALCLLGKVQSEYRSLLLREEDFNYFELSTGRVLLHKGEPDKALAKFEFVSSGNSQNAIHFCYQAQAAIAMGDIDAAQRMVCRASELAVRFPFSQTRKLVDQIALQL